MHAYTDLMQRALYHPNRFTLRHHLKAYPLTEALTRFISTRREAPVPTVVPDDALGVPYTGELPPEAQAWQARVAERFEEYELTGAVLTQQATSDGSLCLMLRAYAPHVCLHDTFTLLADGRETGSTTVYGLGPNGELVIAINGAKIVTKHLGTIEGRKVIHAGEDFATRLDTLMQAERHASDANLQPHEWDALAQAHARAVIAWLTGRGIVELTGDTPGAPAGPAHT